MSLNPETKRQIKHFAKEQSAYYLEEAELGYLQKLRRKGEVTREKLEGKLKKVTGDTNSSKEARDDMMLYMSDYISDLMMNGLSEQESFEKAKVELTFKSGSVQALSLQDKYQEYYETQDFAQMQAVGLYYGAGVIIGSVLGGVAGLLLGTTRFPEITFWIPIVVGTAVGCLLGVGFGLLMNASLVRKNIK